MAKIEIKIKPNKAQSEILVDGFDLSHLINEGTLDLGGDFPTLTVNLPIFEEALVNGEIKLLLDDRTVDLLKEWGWTPPKRGKGVSDE